MKHPYRYSVGSLFAGIGGICIGFSQAGFDIKWSNERDKFACQTYRFNEDGITPGLEVTECDVVDFNPGEYVDVLAGGFPCQPYSIAGYMNGLEDKRGRPMFDEILRIAEEVQPRAIFLENVGNLRTFDDGRTFPILMKLLEQIGYFYHYEFVLNSKDYSGIAQFRNRIYIVAFRDYTYASNFRLNYYNFVHPQPIKTGFNEIVGSPSRIPEKYYYSQDEPGKCISVRYNEHFIPAVTEHGIFYQYRRHYMRRNMNGLCPALTASMGGGGHNVPIILDSRGIRKLTPRECLKVQGFPSWYRFPEDMADGHKYRQAGNSVSVPVIRQFANAIYYALKMEDDRLRGE